MTLLYWLITPLVGSNWLVVVFTYFWIVFHIGDGEVDEDEQEQEEKEEDVGAQDVVPEVEPATVDEEEVVGEGEVDGEEVPKHADMSEAVCCLSVQHTNIDPNTRKHTNTLI